MSGYNFLENFPTDLGQWLNARLMEQILYLEGGWEHWMQIDFLGWLSNRTPDVDFRREVPGTGVRFDWVINSYSPDYVQFAIELKCQTTKSSPQSFKGSVEKDINKMQKCKIMNLVKLSIVAVIGAGPIYDWLQKEGYKLYYTYNDSIYFLIRNFD